MKTINFNLNNFEVKFYNPITSKLEYVGRYKEESEAIDSFIRYETNFYSKNKIMLPKCINVVKNKGFSLSTSIKHYKGFKTIHLGFFRTMDEAKHGKIDFISKFF